MPRSSGGRSRREPCAKCGLPVFIAERLNVGKHLYHRTCFRCARCNSQLALANYYETETENQFCCETCTDEEQTKQISDGADLPETITFDRSLSDEEKSASVEKCDHNTDDYSYMFETALEELNDKSLLKSSQQNDEFKKTRSRFITSQIEDSECDSNDDDEKAPELPKSKPPDISSLRKLEDSENIEPLTYPKDLTVETETSILNSEIVRESCDSGFIPQSFDSVVNSSFKVSDLRDKDQPETPVKKLDINEVITKENKFPSNDITNVSLVKTRMQLFENKLSGDQSKGRLKKKCDIVIDLKNTNAEEKFIHTVPLVEAKQEEATSSTGLEVISLSGNEASSDSSIKENSLINVLDNKNEINHTEQKHEVQEINKSLESSIITINSSTTEDDSVNIIESSDDINVESIIELSDSVEVSHTTKKEYPEDLNPFSDEEEEDEDQEIKTNQSGNPFEDEVEIVLKKVKPRLSSITGKNEGTPEHMAVIRIQRESYNPFDDDDDANEILLESSKHAVKVISAPRISLNPFWSDGEEPEEEVLNKPVPLPRKNRSSTVATPEPKPRRVGLSASTGLLGSNTSLASGHSSTTASARKKKPAPKPPAIIDKPDSTHSSLTSSPSPSVQHSPKATPKIRKSKKAPLPPAVTSTPFITNEDHSLTIGISPILVRDKIQLLKPSNELNIGEWEQEKIIKDEVNRNRQSKDIDSSETSTDLSKPNKAMNVKLRRKGPAPSRPIVQRRHIKPLPIAKIKHELDFIEIQQQGLEKQGVRLEQIIREKCEGPSAELDGTLSLEVEDLILQLFELVNEKNELFRKQTELMYLRRQQRLEEEYADLEYQIHCLMIQPEVNKTDSDKAKEEELIKRLLEVVERRNEIVECLEMDRVREAEEDDSINNQMNLYVLKREDENINKNKQKKKDKKEKKLKFKTNKKIDVDKDIDECESSGASLPINKEKKKKKFNIF